MVRVIPILLLLFMLGSPAQPMEGRPAYHDYFLADPLRAEGVQGCGTCHVDPNGGGTRNEFGLAFAANGTLITPMLRVEWPDRFDVSTAVVGDTTLYFADSESRFLVAEVGGERSLVDLVENGYSGPAVEEEVVERESNFSFFITSVGIGNGGNLGGLVGADAHCQSLAEAADSGTKTWRAYLSTSIEGRSAINAGDRIGSGPWYNFNEMLIARGVTDLHTNDSKLNKDMALNELGDVVNGVGDSPNRHDILTGTLSDGTAAIGMSCDNWVTNSSESNAQLGHFDRQGGGDAGSSWNAAHPSRGCSQDDLEGTGGAGLFYCFAID